MIYPVCYTCLSTSAGLKFVKIKKMVEKKQNQEQSKEQAQPTGKGTRVCRYTLE